MSDELLDDVASIKGIALRVREDVARALIRQLVINPLVSELNATVRNGRVDPRRWRRQLRRIGGKTMSDPRKKHG